MSTLIAKSILISSSGLISGDMTLKDRIEILRPYFSPKFHEFIHIDPLEEQSRKYLNNTYDMKGYISVNPPPGNCFIIQRKDNREDISVCKKRYLSFYLRDLNQKGQLSWLVKTGPDDFGSKVSWESPYRFGKLVSNDMPWPGDARDFMIKSCVVTSDGSQGRKITINLFHSRSWSIRIPKKELLVKQPMRPKPFLYVQQSESSNGLASPKQTSEQTEQAGQPSKKNIFEPDKDEDLNTIKSSWQMHPRNAFHLDQKFVNLGSSVPTGAQGKCRYKYSGYDFDPSTGALECKNIGDFKWIYLPLPCLKEKSGET